MHLPVCYKRYFYCLFASILLILSHSSQANGPHPISVLTWNVWFNDESAKWRYPLILDTLSQQNTDIIALQEVTPLFMTYLNDHSIRSKYHITLSQKKSHYQNITLSKAFPLSSRTIALDSEQGRKALIVELSFQGICSPLSIANVHLESPLSEHELRIAQLKKVLEELLIKSPSVIAGDFNFGNSSEEEVILSEHFNDIAKKTNQHDKVTFDIINNKWAKQTKYWFEPSRRLDRIYASERLVAQLQYKLIKQISSANGHYPSDHYAVRADLNYHTEKDCFTAQR